MKYLKKAETLTSALNNIFSPEYIEPSVFEVVNPEDVLYNYRDKMIYDEKFKKDDYFSIYTLGAGRLTLQINGGWGSSDYLEYSINGGTWTNWRTWTTIDLESNSTVRFRGNRGYFSTSNSSSTTITFNNYFVTYGNMYSIINPDGGDLGGFTKSNVAREYAFANVFSNNSYLISAKNLIIPDSTGNYTYYKMFQNCSKLCDIPENFPKGTGTGCYERMFYNCSNITDLSNLTISNCPQRGWAYTFYNSGVKKLPTIQAGNIGSYCFQWTFSNCNLLTEIPTNYLQGLKATSYSFERMFSTCKNLKYIPYINQENIYDHSCDRMFSECTSLENVNGDIFHDVTKLSSYCFQGMFRDCTNLKKVEYLPMVSQISDFAYSEMFYECTSLTTVAPIVSFSIAGNKCFGDMFNNCKSLTNIAFFLPCKMIYFPSSPGYMPFYDTFTGCTSLKTIICTLEGWNQEGPIDVSWLPDNNGDIYLLNTSSWTDNSLNGWTRHDLYINFGGNVWYDYSFPQLYNDLTITSEEYIESVIDFVSNGARYFELLGSHILNDHIGYCSVTTNTTNNYTESIYKIYKSSSSSCTITKKVYSDETVEYSYSDNYETFIQSMIDNNYGLYYNNQLNKIYSSTPPSAYND